MDFFSCQMMKLLTDWLPFLIFIGLLIYFMRKVKGSQVDQLKQMNDYRESHVEELRKINTALERIVAALEKSRPGP